MRCDACSAAAVVRVSLTDGQQRSYCTECDAKRQKLIVAVADARAAVTWAQAAAELRKELSGVTTARRMSALLALWDRRARGEG